MKSIHIVFILAISLSTAACTDWIYRIDVPQGNYLDQKDVDKLRMQMSKEQVKFVLGNPVIQDSFDSNTWYYVYDMKRGMSKRGKNVRKELIIQFESGRLTSIRGDFDEPEEFNIPLDV